MGSAAVLDLESLLRPIPGEQAAGVDLRQDQGASPIYYRIKDVRSAARAAERQGEFESVIGPAEANAWRPILGLATEALGGLSKDLELVAWLIEALARTHGFAGLRDGFLVAKGLVESTWDGLYPRPDEDGLETRIAPLTGLNGAGAEGTLCAPISRIPITQGSSASPVAAWNCAQAIELERQPDKKADRIAAGATSMDQVQAAVRETPPAFFVELIADIDAALAALAALGKALDARCGSQAPPLSAIRGAIENAATMLRHVARDVLPAPEAAVGAGEPAPSAAPRGADAPAGGSAPSGPLRSREDAFRLLGTVAEYFRRAEPHSPIAFLIERTIRWGRMPLPELLAELIPDESARSTFGQLTGVLINPPAE